MLLAARGACDPAKRLARRRLLRGLLARPRSRAELPSVHYRDRLGREKVVRYWAMVPVAGQLAPHHEVDEARWLDVESAPALLSYDHDRNLVAVLVLERR